MGEAEAQKIKGGRENDRSNSWRYGREPLRI